jgi:hypothetical protein
MFSFLTNRITILVFLALLMTMTSFSPSYRSTDKAHDSEDDALLRKASSTHEHVAEHNEQGLSNATVELIAPEVLPVGEPLYINVALAGYEKGLECLLTWYVNDEPVKEERIVTGTEIPGFNHEIEYSRIMEETIDIKVSIHHTTMLSELQIIEAEKTIVIENHDISHWNELETQRVLSMVTSRYNGDFTLEWAENNDYEVFEKELYINAKGYTSETEYLIWVNRCFQRVNVFTGTGRSGEWELHEVFIISTSLWLNSTPRGTTTIPSRTSAGWVFPEAGYRVEPVVRFWPERSSEQGQSFAFHSRPLDIRTREIVDDRIGVPASSGCIRMYCDDAWWIYNNIPDHTTVVIY